MNDIVNVCKALAADEAKPLGRSENGMFDMLTFEYVIGSLYSHFNFATTVIANAITLSFATLNKLAPKNVPY